MTNSFSWIIKRNGQKVKFVTDRITTVIKKAGKATNTELDSAKLTDAVLDNLSAIYDNINLPTVEGVQDIVEKVLIQYGYAKTAKAYILYRQKRSEERKIKEDILGKIDDSKLSPNGLIIAKSRYLLKDSNGDVVETPKEMFRRVAKEIAKIEKKYDNDHKEMEEKFYDIMSTLEFVPGGRILAGAGTKHSQLYSCFVLPVEDSIKGIFRALYEKALLHRVGGGTGFSFSRIRQKGKRVVQSDAYASGPVKFMYMFNHASEVTIHSGNRKGANMGSLSVHHPDIIEFITCKERKPLENFNISVEITDEFMEAVKKNLSYNLVDPQLNTIVDTIPARNVFDLIVTMAWKNGDPGILFIDRINKDNPTPKLGRIETTDPCGDQPMLPYDACNLGAINLSLFVTKNKKIDWDRLKHVAQLGVHFLDNVVDSTNIPVKKVKDMIQLNRRIGLGIMGFSDMLYKLEIPYNSGQACAIAEDITKFIYDNAFEQSKKMAKERGVFPNWENSIFHDKFKLRNAGILNISPTGSRSIFADTSSGIEPNFALGYTRKIAAGFDLASVNNILIDTLRDEGLYTEEIIEKIAKTGTLNDIEEIPERIKRIFITAHDVSPMWHVRIQAAFQKHIDNAISKTVNFSKNATIGQIKKVFMKAYKMGCKGITVYRDGSINDQVIQLSQW